MNKRFLTVITIVSLVGFWLIMGSCKVSGATGGGLSGTPLSPVAGGSSSSVSSNTLMSKVFVTPYDFGAVGDATTDDTVALQAWLNAASISNVIAYLSPAVGSYFKITSELYVTNIAGIKIVGTGGNIFVSGVASALTRSRIHQATVGANGLMIYGADKTTNASPAAGMMDSLHLEGFLITGPNSPTGSGSIGLGFAGNNTDADCSIISQVGVHGFGYGMYIQSLANAIFDAIAPGNNGTGVWIPAFLGNTANATVPNNIAFYNSQISYNYTNQMLIQNGNIGLYNCDVTCATSGTAAVGLESTNSHAIYITSGSIYGANSRFEEYTYLSAIAATGTNGQRPQVFLYECGSSVDGAHLSTKSYTITATNANIRISGGSYAMLASDGYPILATETTGAADPDIRSRDQISIKYITGGAATVAPWIVAGSWARNIFDSTTLTGLEGELQMNQHSQGQDANGGNAGGGYDGNDSLTLSAKMYAMNLGDGSTGSGLADRTVRKWDLLKYWKDKLTVIQAYNLLLTNCYQLSSNTPSQWPTAPQGSSGGIAEINSNGVAMMMTSDRSATWTDTNYVSIVKSSYLATDATSTSITFATTGIGVTVTSGHKYAFIAELYLSDSTAADGAKIDFNGGSATSSNFRAQVTAFDTALNIATVTTALSTSVAASTFTGSGAFEIHGSFEPSSTGTFIIRFAQNAHTVGTLTLARGSHIVMHDVK